MAAERLGQALWASEFAHWFGRLSQPGRTNPSSNCSDGGPYGAVASLEIRDN